LTNSDEGTFLSFGPSPNTITLSPPLKLYKSGPKAQQPIISIINTNTVFVDDFLCNGTDQVLVVPDLSALADLPPTSVLLDRVISQLTILDGSVILGNKKVVEQFLKSPSSPITMPQFELNGDLTGETETEQKIKRQKVSADSDTDSDSDDVEILLNLASGLAKRLEIEIAATLAAESLRQNKTQSIRESEFALSRLNFGETTTGCSSSNSSSSSSSSNSSSSNSSQMPVFAKTKNITVPLPPSLSPPPISPPSSPSNLVKITSLELTYSYNNLSILLDVATPTPTYLTNLHFSVSSTSHECTTTSGNVPTLSPLDHATVSISVEIAKCSSEIDRQSHDFSIDAFFNSDESVVVCQLAIPFEFFVLNQNTTKRIQFGDHDRQQQQQQQQQQQFYDHRPPLNVQVEHGLKKSQLDWLSSVNNKHQRIKMTDFGFSLYADQPSRRLCLLQVLLKNLPDIAKVGKRRSKKSILALGKALLAEMQIAKRQGLGNDFTMECIEETTDAQVETELRLHFLRTNSS